MRTQKREWRAWVAERIPSIPVQTLHQSNGTWVRIIFKILSFHSSGKMHFFDFDFDCNFDFLCEEPDEHPERYPSS